MDLSKVIQKFLISEEFDVDGNKYQFISLKRLDDGFYDIIVNVTLPKKGQSYAIPVFSEHIHSILSNFWKYFDTSFSYSEKILVNGEEPVKSGVYISPKKEELVLSTMRNQIRRVSLKTDIGKLSFSIYWKPFHPQFVILDDVNINFRFFIELSNFDLNDTPVKPNLRIADEITGVVTELLLESDGFRNRCDEVIYSVIGDEIDINHTDDLYFQVMYYVSKLDGFHVEAKWRDMNLEPDMFT